MTRLALGVLLWSALAAADGGKTLAAVGGTCSVTVPVDWSTTGPLALSPDKKVSITVSAPKNVDSIAALKQSVKSVYKDVKVTKDSPSELELEGKAVDGKPNVYRAIAGAKGLCAAEVRYEAGTTDGARQLVRTLRQ